MVLTGCRTISVLHPSTAGGTYQPDNVYRVASVLPSDLRRVAVLPLANSANSGEVLDGCSALQPILVTGLNKTKRFEVVSIDPQLLQAKTGRESWSAGEMLPANFLAVLREASGCDAVLFAELTEYRAYAPIAIGWRLKLVDARTGFALWAGDEIFDARRPDVVAGASRFPAPSGGLLRGSKENWAVLHSPRQFAQYAVAQMFDTLPVR